MMGGSLGESPFALQIKEDKVERMDNINNTKNTIFHWHDFKLKLVLEGIIVGFFAGLLIVFYRYAIEKALDFSIWVYKLQHQKLWLIPVWIIVLLIGGYAVGVIVEKEPMASGSGIPQTEGVLLRRLSMRWWSVILAKLVGGIISIGAGLSLGREGPSIQMGAAVGQGTSRIFKRIKLEEKFLITSGASAGLSAAFNAPLAGVIFSLEEVHKNFSPVVLASALAASITADFVSDKFFGLKPVFNFRHFSVIPLNSYGSIIVLGIIAGLMGILFNKALLGTQDLYKRLTAVPARFKPIIAFLFAGVMGYFLPQVLGGGNKLVTDISVTPLPMRIIIILLLAKFIFTMISYGSSAPGGIFLPLLVIGALIGTIYGNMMNYIFGFSRAYTVTFMILGMAGYFSAIVKAPITGIVLITEMTGSFNHMLAIAVVSLIAYMITDLFNSKPIYESLLHRILNKGTSKFNGECSTKVLIESAVCIGSLIEGKKIKDVDWPSQCLLVSIKRGAEEIIPNGETTVYAGDYLISLTNEDIAAEIRECLSGISEEIIN